MRDVQEITAQKDAIVVMGNIDCPKPPVSLAPLLFYYLSYQCVPHKEDSAEIVGIPCLKTGTKGQSWPREYFLFT